MNLSVMHISYEIVKLTTIIWPNSAIVTCDQLIEQMANIHFHMAMS